MLEINNKKQQEESISKPNFLFFKKTPFFFVNFGVVLTVGLISVYFYIYITVSLTIPLIWFENDFKQIPVFVQSKYGLRYRSAFHNFGLRF